MTRFPALRHRNFRLLWFGQLVSFSGSMMQMAAILWHVSLLVSPENKALALGLVGAVRVVPIVVFSMIGGVVADVVDRRRLMLLTQSAMLIAAALLAWLTFRGLTSVWPIFLLSALGSAAGSFDAPARQSLVPNLVPRADLPNAISLNSVMFQIASVLGPSLAGITIAGLGVGWAYLLNALSFVAVLTALFLMRHVPGHDATRRTEISISAAMEGLRFVFRTPIIRSTMLLDFFATFFSSATALLPIFCQDVLRVGAHGYGWLYAAPSVGALLAGAYMVGRSEGIDRRGVVLVWAVLAYGAATILFGVSRVFWLSFLALALTGAADTLSMIIRNVVRQLTTPDHLRGRMTSVSMIFFMGGPQLGELEAGLVAQWLGAPISVISGGIACLVATGWIAARDRSLLNYRKNAAPAEAA